MKAPKTYKRWINKVRKRHGKKNGVISFMYIDDYRMEIMVDQNKAHYRRHKMERPKGDGLYDPTEF